MTRTERLELVSKFESAYERVEKLIAGLPEDELRFIPPLADAWSIHDFLVHFLDADASLSFRLRGSVAEPGIKAPVWEEELWQKRLHYEAEDGRACLRLAEGLRSFLAVGLRAIADEDWSKYYFLHSVRGRLELPALLDMYTEHVAFHIALIERNITAYGKRS
jgi:hypothetical protein